MKHFLVFALALVMTLPTFARSTYESGFAQESGFCNGAHDGYFCIERIKTRAENDGKYNAERTCRLRGGTPRNFTSACNNSCFPNSLNRVDQDTLVQCRSSCSVRCDYQD